MAYWIIKRGNKFQGVVQVPPDVPNRFKPTYSRSFGKKKDAVEWASEINLQIKKGKWRDPRTGTRPHIQEATSGGSEPKNWQSLCESYIDARRSGLTGQPKPLKTDKDTVRKDIADVRRLQGVPEFQKPLWSLDANDVAAYVERRRGETPNPTHKNKKRKPGERVSTQTIRNEISKCRAVITFGRRKLGLNIKNPFQEYEDRHKAELPRSEGRTRTLRPGEREKILEWFDQHDNPRVRTEIKALFILATETGMRQGELLSLTGEDLWPSPDEFDRIRLKGEKTKNSEGRNVMLTPLAQQAIRDLRRNDPKGRIINYAQSYVGDIFRKMRDEVLGGDDIRWHDMRHHALTEFLNQGLSTLIIQKQSGHKSLQQLERYINVGEFEQAKAFKMLSEIVSDEKPLTDAQTERLVELLAGKGLTLTADEISYVSLGEN